MHLFGASSRPFQSKVGLVLRPADQGDSQALLIPFPELVGQGLQPPIAVSFLSTQLRDERLQVRRAHSNQCVARRCKGGDDRPFIIASGAVHRQAMRYHPRVPEEPSTELFFAQEVCGQVERGSVATRCVFVFPLLRLGTNSTRNG